MKPTPTEPSTYTRPQLVADPCKRHATMHASRARVQLLGRALPIGGAHAMHAPRTCVQPNTFAPGGADTHRSSTGRTTHTLPPDETTVHTATDGLVSCRPSDTLRSALGANGRYSVHPQHCSKRALARQYFPDSTSDTTAIQHLRRWIKQCPALREALAQESTTPHRHYFTTREVQLIMRHLGEP